MKMRKFAAIPLLVLAGCGQNSVHSSVSADKVDEKAKSMFCKSDDKVKASDKLETRFIVRATLGEEANEFKNFYLVPIDIKDANTKAKFGSSSKKALKAVKGADSLFLALPQKKDSKCSYAFSYSKLPGTASVSSTCLEKGKEVERSFKVGCSYLKDDGEETTESLLKNIEKNAEVANGSADSRKAKLSQEEIYEYFTEKKDRKDGRKFTFCGRSIDNVDISLKKEDSFKRLAQLLKEIAAEQDKSLEGLRKLQKDGNLETFGYLEGSDGKQTCHIVQFIAVTKDGYVLDLEYDMGD